LRLRLLMSEALRSVTANLSTTFAATATILIGMFLVGVLIAFGTYARSWSDQKKGELLVEVFYCTESHIEPPCSGKEATPKQINAVRRQLESNELVREDGVDFVPKSEALEKMRRQAPDIVEGLPYNPLPDAHRVIPKRGEDAREVKESLTPPPPGVQLVKDGEKTASRILRVARVIEAVFLVAIVILLAASILLIANTIRLSIFARRREIEVMKLVGASNWFVRGPFMLEGLLCGLVGSIAAVFLLILGKEAALPSILGKLDAGAGVHAISFELNALILVLIGLFLGAAGSGLTLRRFLQV
jgi:cell division transport system permease protein